jgi:uncharacterized protein with NRDE domain
MCTVSFVKHSSGFSLTSNRDEVSSRPTLPPEAYQEYDQVLVYPNDEIADGTWIATSESNISLCLLNGAFEKHQRNLPYNRSRGQVLKERFGFESHQSFISQVNLKNVEPFTLLMIDHKNLSDIDFKILIWDESKKHILNVDTNAAHIWASSTLYDKEQRKMRKKWFADFILKNQKPDSASLFNFHTGSYTKNKKEDIVMQRNNELKTVSVSQINISKNQNSFIYRDIEKEQEQHLNLDKIWPSV